jgi:hypothetical protein
LILVCAATGAEARACARGAASGEGVEVLRTGVGPVRSGRALAARLGLGPRPALVVSSGFAGALTEGLELLAWVTASEVLRLEGVRVVPVELPSRLLRVVPGARPCPFVSASEVRAPGAARPDLDGPAAVDMESAALAQVAGAAGIPFAVLRLVTDSPAAPLPEIGRIAAATLASLAPGERLRHGSRLAAGALADPRGALGFARASLGWCTRLREGWAGFSSSGMLRGMAEG